MSTLARREPAAEWLTIREASALVGVSVATLRRWCDAGEVRAFTTPGGHRRFLRSAVLGLIPMAGQRRPRLGRDGETAIRIVRAYRREVRRWSAAPPTPEVTTDPARHPFRDQSAAMVSALVDLLDAANGDSLNEAIDMFVRFRALFVHELGAIARGRGFDAIAATALLEAASDEIDGLLPSVISGFEAASARAAGAGEDRAG